MVCSTVKTSNGSALKPSELAFHVGSRNILRASMCKQMASALHAYTIKLDVCIQMPDYVQLPQQDSLHTIADT